MRTVLKFDADQAVTVIPVGPSAQPLFVACQREVPRVWVWVATDEPVDRSLVVQLVGTGCEAPDDFHTYLGSFVMGQFQQYVFHAFWRIDQAAQ